MQVSFNFRQSLPRTIWDWLILIFLLLAALFFLMPIYVMVVTGLKQAQNVSLSTMWQPPTYLSRSVEPSLPQHGEQPSVNDSGDHPLFNFRGN
jgi:ABC-type glycerol-3-phosphate transport system permease component